MAKILLSCQKGADVRPYLRALACLGQIMPAHESADGEMLVLGGGGDISPRFYRYRGPIERVRIEDEARDRMELSLVRQFLCRKKPILGICRGMQLINVALGGTLVEDIGACFGENRHENTRHLIDLMPGSTLCSLLGRHCTVNSFHHQAVRHPGRGLRVTARAVDGICEAVEHVRLPILGVQWHPERMDMCEMRAVFAYFGEFLK